MPGRASNLVVIPASFWQRPEVLTALRDRTISQFFALVQQYTGASQSTVSDIMRGVQQVESLACSSASPTR
jgi:hypothetical protein